MVALHIILTHELEGSNYSSPVLPLRPLCPLRFILILYYYIKLAM